MIGLMASSSVAAAASSCSSDHTRHSGSSVKMSIRTLASTRIMLFAARLAHDVRGGESGVGAAARMAKGGFQALQARSRGGLDQHAAFSGLENDFGAGGEAVTFAQGLGDGDLALAGEFHE